MSPRSTIAVTVAVLGWLVSRIQVCEARRQARIIYKILRRYTLYDYERADEADNLVSALEELAQRPCRKPRLHNQPLSSGAVARRQCLMSHQFRCAISGALLGFDGQVHHIIPLSFGGGWGQENLCYIDAELHQAIHNLSWTKADGITDEQWGRVLEYRAIIAEAELRWKKRYSRLQSKEVRRTIAA